MIVILHRKLTMQIKFENADTSWISFFLFEVTIILFCPISDTLTRARIILKCLWSFFFVILRQKWRSFRKELISFLSVVSSFLVLFFRHFVYLSLTLNLPSIDTLSRQQFYSIELKFCEYNRFFVEWMTFQDLVFSRLCPTS